MTAPPRPVGSLDRMGVKVRVYLLGGGLMVEPACASSDGGPFGRAPKGPYQSSPLKGPLLSSPLPYGRAPKGDGGLNSRACLRILFLGEKGYRARGRRSLPG